MTTHSTGEKINFTFYNHSEGIFMDEKKKRYMDFRDMDRMTYYRYKNQFTQVINNTNIKLSLLNF